MTTTGMFFAIVLLIAAIPLLKLLLVLTVTLFKTSILLAVAVTILPILLVLWILIGSNNKVYRWVDGCSAGLLDWNSKKSKILEFLVKKPSRKERERNEEFFRMSAIAALATDQVVKELRKRK